MDKHIELRTALLRSHHAYAVYADMLGGKLTPESGGPRQKSERERMKEIQAEIEAADAEVALLKKEVLGTPSSD